VLDECFEHNDHLRADRHLVAEVTLQPPETALTLYWKRQSRNDGRSLPQRLKAEGCQRYRRSKDLLHPAVGHSSQK
jgi:hypothetical protein